MALSARIRSLRGACCGMARKRLHGPGSAPVRLPQSMQLCGALTLAPQLARHYSQRVPKTGRSDEAGGGMTRLGHDIEMYCMQLCGMPVIHSNSRRRDEAERVKQIGRVGVLLHYGRYQIYARLLISSTQPIPPTHAPPKFSPSNPRALTHPAATRPPASTLRGQHVTWGPYSTLRLDRPLSLRVAQPPAPYLRHPLPIDVASRVLIGPKPVRAPSMQVGADGVLPHNFHYMIRWRVVGALPPFPFFRWLPWIFVTSILPD